jgi:O-antigen/teichoic acid export membrane protein
MSLGQTMRRGVAWVFVGNTGKQLLGFLFGIVLARLLAPEDFGILLTIQVFTGLAGFVAGGGMGQALVRAKETSQADYDIVFTLQIGIGCLIYAFFFFVAPWIAQWYQTPIYTDLLRVSALSFLFRPFANLPGSILHRQMRYKALAFVGIVTLGISSVTSIVMAWFGYGVWSLIWGGMVGSAASMALLIPLARWRPRLSTRFMRGGEIARYGLLVSANDILNYLQQQTAIFILSRTLGPASVGLYNKGESLAHMPHSFITGSVYHVLFRSLATSQDNLDRCRYLYFRSLALVAVYATPFYVGLAWLAEPFMRGVYGERWVAAAAPLALLALAWPFWLINNLSGAVLGALDWLDREFPVQVALLAILALSIFAGLPWGIDGVALGVVGAAVYGGAHMTWLALACLKARGRDLVRALAPAVPLNLLLAAALAAIDASLDATGLGTGTRHDLLRLAVMGAGGALIYALAFLYLPIPMLASERLRWKLKLRLARPNA